ncbi:NADH-quinone oxidoreductase subunit K [Billgrantia kenyensis]|nr:NADH-quinone oxidoreductase subunit K [Halomonas kenyensis]
MPPFLDALLALAMVALATLALLDRQLVRACAWFVAFAVSVALTWWSVGFIWLALLELLLGALLTGAFLFHALDIRQWASAPRGRLARWRDPVPLTWQRALMRLLPALAVLIMLAIALDNLAGTPGPLLVGGMGLIGLGLWAFALHRHLLRRLLAFNVIGTGIFLILMALVGDRNTAAGHGLVVTGLLVALLGTALGALLIRRLNRLDGRRILDVAEAGRSRA